MKKNKLTTRDIAEISLCTALLAICSWICVPAVVPFTLQTFEVAFAALLLGGKKSVISILIYILLGIAGLPVFSGFRSGAAIILCSTGGYLIGFLFLASAIGISCDKLGRTLPVILASSVLGLVLLYLFGTVWYMLIYTQGTASVGAVLWTCVIPFVIPDTVKIFLAVVCAKKLKLR